MDRTRADERESRCPGDATEQGPASLLDHVNRFRPDYRQASTLPKQHKIQDPACG